MSHKPISQPLSTPVLTERLKQLNAKLREILRPIFLKDNGAEWSHFEHEDWHADLMFDVSSERAGSVRGAS